MDLPGHMNKFVIVVVVRATWMYGSKTYYLPLEATSELLQYQQPRLEGGLVLSQVCMPVYIDMSNFYLLSVQWTLVDVRL